MADQDHEALLLDACVVINLLASGISLAEFSEVLRTRFVVTEQVSSEALFLPTDTDARKRIDVQALAAAGAIEITELQPTELDHFVSFAAQVDDGEASTRAAAVHRGLRVATDDRKARRVGTEWTPPVELISTPELLRKCETGQLGDRVAEAVRQIEHRASFRPRRDDADFAWWMAIRER